MKKAKLVKKASAQLTLLQIPIGESREIERKDIKYSSIRTAIRKLKEKGHNFIASEAGLVDSTLVTRIS